MKFDEDPNYSRLIPLFGSLVGPSSSISRKGRATACQVDHLKRKIQRITISQIAWDKNGVLLLRMFMGNALNSNNRGCWLALMLGILHTMVYILFSFHFSVEHQYLLSALALSSFRQCNMLSPSPKVSCGYVESYPHVSNIATM